MTSEREDSLNIIPKGDNFKPKNDSSGLGDDSFNNLLSNRKDSIASKPDDRGSVLSHKFNTRSRSTIKKLNQDKNSFTPTAKNTLPAQGIYKIGLRAKQKNRLIKKKSMRLENKKSSMPFVILEPRERKGGKSFATKVVQDRNKPQRKEKRGNRNNWNRKKGKRKKVLTIEERRKMHAPRRIKDYKKRLSTAFRKALEDIQFREEFISIENCLSEKVYGRAARQLGINWYEGTTDKPCDAIHIIGKDMKIVGSKVYKEMDFTQDQTSIKTNSLQHEHAEE